MPRTKQQFTIVTIENGNLETTTYAGRETLDDALKNLAGTADGFADTLLFTGSPIEFKVEPIITFGDKPTRTRTPRNDEPTVPHKRKRRTKLEMQQARALEAANGGGEVHADHE